MPVTQGLAAVILAAGSSTRMGGANKLLADWRGAPMIRRVAVTALASGVEEVVVVTGHQAREVRRALAGLDVIFADNPDHRDGLSTSLITGLRAVGEGREGAMVLLGDMPAVEVETLNALIEAFRRRGGSMICAPLCNGRRGNPVLWPRVFFDSILELSGDRGARDLLDRHAGRVELVACRDTGVLRDIDRPEDLQ